MAITHKGPKFHYRINNVDVWEWTASDFTPYPGFRAFPYREYSEVFFGPEYKVLRGGSWATHPSAVRTTFRNWDFPIRRQIFAGFRCAATPDIPMCRHLAYLGPPAALSDLLFDAPHTLARQAECPRLQTSGTSNPDGWGVAWYVDGATTPDRYRTVTPIWDDRAFADRAHDLRSGAFLAAARLASPGASLVDTGNAPFVADRWSFSLNGIVHGFPDGVGDALRAASAPTGWRPSWATPTPRCSSRWCCRTSTTGPDPRTRWRASCATSSP